MSQYPAAPLLTNRKKFPLRLALLLLLWLSACQAPATQLATPVPGLAQTLAVQTMQADRGMQTLIASPTPALTPSGAGVTPEQPSIPTPSDPGVINAVNAGRLQLRYSLGQGVLAGEPRYSPDGKWLAVPSGRGILLYDTGSYQLPRLLTNSPVHSREGIIFAPDGRLLAVGSRLISLEDGKTVLDLPFPDQPTYGPFLGETLFSPDGQWVAIDYTSSTTGSNCCVGIWRLADGKLVHTLDGQSKLAFSPDGRFLAVSLYRQDEQTLESRLHTYLYDLQSGERLHDWPDTERAIPLPAGQALVESGRLVRLVDLSSGKTLRSFNGQNFTVSPDQQELALFFLGKVRRYRIADGQLVGEMAGNFASANAATLSYSLDGQTLLGLTRDEECCGQVYQNTLSIWNRDGSLRHAISQEYGTLFLSIEVAPDGQAIVVTQAESDGLQVLRTADGAPLAMLQDFTRPLTQLTFLPDGQQLLTSDLLLYQITSGQVEKFPPAWTDSYVMALHPDGQVLAHGSNFWRIQERQLTNELSNKMQQVFNTMVTSSAFSPDGQWIAMGYTSGNLQIWNFEQQTLLWKQAVCATEYQVSGLAFSANSQRLAVACADGWNGDSPSVQVYQVSAQGGRLQELTGAPGGAFSRVAYAPNGLYLAAAGYASPERQICPNDTAQAQVWDAASGQPLLTIPTGCVHALAFSPNSQLLALALLRGNVEIWSIPDGQKVFALDGSLWDPAGAIAFSPDGRLLALGYQDGLIRLWGLAGGQ